MPPVKPEPLVFDEGLTNLPSKGFPPIQIHWVVDALTVAKPRRGGWRKTPDPVRITARLNSRMAAVSPTERPPSLKQVHAYLERLWLALEEVEHLLDSSDSEFSCANIACIGIDSAYAEISKKNMAISPLEQRAQIDKKSLIKPDQILLSHVLTCNIKLTQHALARLHVENWPQSSDIPRLGPNEDPAIARFIIWAAIQLHFSTDVAIRSPSPTSPVIRFIASLLDHLGQQSDPSSVAKRYVRLMHRARMLDLGHDIIPPFDSLYRAAKRGFRR